MKKNRVFSKIFFLTLLFGIIFLNNSSAQNSWVQKTNFGGTARQTCFGFSIGSFGYIGGGYDGVNKNDFWRYDPSTNTWTQKANVPAAIRQASTFVINGIGYLTGGIISSPPYNKTLWAYDPTANSWTTKAQFPGTGIYGAGSFAIGNKGYFGVGNTNTANGPYTNTFYEYDATADAWTQKANFPATSRYAEIGISLNGKGYFGFGVNQASGVVWYKDWYEYDPTTDTWTAKANLPGVERGYPANFAINNRIYIGNGNIQQGAPNTINDFYEYNQSTDSWTQIQNFGGSKRYAGASFSINNIGYVGCGTNFSVLFNEFWAYQPTSISLILSHTDVSCFGGSNGSATVTVSNGNAPFNYIWSNGQTTASITGLNAGTYTCTVTDASANTAVSDNIIVSQPLQINLAFTTLNAKCGNSNGSINLTVTGGTSPYSYSWSNGFTTEDLSGLNSASYNVTVIDANNCTASDFTSVGNTSGPTLSETHINPTCGNANGSIDLTVTGGTGPYSYSWSNNSTASSQLILPALEDAQIGFHDNYNSANQNGGAADFYAAFWQPGASGGENGGRGLMKFDLSGFSSGAEIISASLNLYGRGPYGGGDAVQFGNFGSNESFLERITSPWSEMVVTWNTQPTYSAQNQVSLPASSSAIQDYLNINVTQLIKDLIDSSVSNYGMCLRLQNEAVTRSLAFCSREFSDASKHPSLTLTYVSDIISSAQDLLNIGAGNYTVIVTDANGCTSSITINLTDIPGFTLNESHLNASCGNNNGSVDVTVSGGTGPFTYHWNNNATTQDLTGVGTGTYGLTVTDANQCVATISASVGNTNGPTLGETHVNASCGNNNGSVDVTVSGGTGPFTYHWNNNATTQDLTGVGTGTYGLTVTDANQCVATISASVGNTNGPTLGETHVNASCGNNNGSVDVTVSGGTGPFTYHWNNNATTQDLTGVGTGTYGLTVTDANQCVATISASVGNTNGPTLGETHVNASCGNNNGSVDVTVSGGTGPFTYHWNNNATTQDLTGVGTGTYGLTVTDANQCVATISASVGNTNGPTLGETHVNASCGNNNGSVDVTVSGGTGPFTYHWNNNATTQDLTGVGTGTYGLTVTDANQCVATISASVGNTNGLSINETHVSATCGVANGLINITVSGGTSPFNFSWSNGSSTEDLASIGEGQYCVTVSDASGCVQSTCITISCTSTSCTGFKTYTQGGWGANPHGNNPGVYLHAHFTQAFPSGLSVGGASCAGSHWLQLSTSQAVTDFLPSGGTPAKLLQNWTNPGGLLNNTFAGQVVAATLNIGFDNWDPNFSSNSIHLGDLIYTSGIFSGWSVQQVLNEANKKLSGCPSTYSCSLLSNALNVFNKNFNGGNVDLGHLTCNNNDNDDDDDEEDDDRFETNMNQMYSLNVFPNPANNKINVTLNNGCYCDEQATITISNLIGQTVLSETENLNAGELNKEIVLPDNIVEGVYFISVRSANYAETKRFVVSSK